MEAGDFETGGFIVPPNYVPELIELLRPRSVVRRMGPSEAPLVNGSLTLPKLTGGRRPTTSARAPISRRRNSPAGR